MATPPLQKRLVGSIKDHHSLDPTYRSTAINPDNGMELPVMIGGERNPLFLQHMQDRLKFLCSRSDMSAGPDFHQRYHGRWGGDHVYGMVDDLVLRLWINTPDQLQL